MTETIIRIVLPVFMLGLFALAWVTLRGEFKNIADLSKLKPVANLKVLINGKKLVVVGGSLSGSLDEVVVPDSDPCLKVRTYYNPRIEAEFEVINSGKGFKSGSVCKFHGHNFVVRNDSKISNLTRQVRCVAYGKSIEKV